MRDLLVCWAQILLQGSLASSLRKGATARTPGESDIWYGPSLRTRRRSLLWGHQQEALLDALSDGCLKGQQDARSTSRCLGLSKRRQQTTLGALPSLRESAGERSPAVGMSRSRWGREVSEEPTKVQIRKGVHFQHLPDSRTECQLLMASVKLQLSRPLLFSYSCCYPGGSESEVSKRDKGKI